MKKYCILCCIFALLAACSGIDYEQQLERFEEMNRTDVPLCVDSVQPIVNYYDHWWHSRNHRMRAYYMLGCAYRDQSSAPRALENYQRAVNIADTTDADCDLNVLMRVHSQMSQIYLQQRLLEQEEKELHIAERLSWQIGDTLSALIFEELICNDLYNNGLYKECISRSKKLYHKYLEYGYEDDAPLAYGTTIKSYLKIKDYVNARVFLSIYEKCPFFKKAPNKISEGINTLYLLKGQYFIGVGEIDSADFYFRRATSMENKLLPYKGLYQVFEHKHNADSTLKYTRLYSEAKERNFDEVQTVATIQTNKLYDYSVEQQKAREQAEKASQLSKLLVIAILLVITLIILLLLYRRRKKRKITQLIQQYQTAVQELHEAEEDLNAEKLKQVNDKNLIVLHEEKIKNLSTQVDTLRQTIRKIESRSNRIIIEEADIVKHLMASRMIGKAITPDEWSTLRKLVEENHPTFYEQMNSRQHLSHTEYMVCVLTVSGFNPTDIEVLMGKSNSFSAMTKKRLCVKVFGIEGKPQDFDRLLHQSY